MLNQVFLYCLGYAAERYGVEVHAYCLMSNHMHLVLTDPQGTLPRFMHWLDLFLAKCVNAMLGRWESVWAGGSYNPVVLLDEPAILEKIALEYGGKRRGAGKATASRLKAASASAGSKEDPVVLAAS